jgi:hypothetical protein
MTLAGASVQLSILKVPAPPPVVEAIQELVVETAIDLAGAFSIRFGLAIDQLGDYGLLALDPFKPFLPVTIRIGTGVVPLPLAVINGFVTGQRALWKEGGKSTHHIHGTDITGIMNLQEKVQPWPNMPDSVVAAAIFATYAVIPEITPTAPRQIEPLGTPMQRGTDIRHLRRMARRNGFDCYVLPEPVTGIDTGHFGPPVLVGVPQAVLNVNMGPATNVSDVSVHYDMAKPTAALTANIDTASKAPQPALAPMSLQIPMGVEPAQVRALAGAGLSGAVPLVMPTGNGNFLTPESQPALQAIVDRSSFAVALEATGGVDLGVLRPGGLVALRGVGRLFNGLYQVTKNRLTFSEGRFEQRFSARRNAVTMTGAEPYVSV